MLVRIYCFYADYVLKSKFGFAVRLERMNERKIERKKTLNVVIRIRRLW